MLICDGWGMSVIEPRAKRTYVRTKLVKDKPVNMAKLAIPFERGWNRESRMRGISKAGKISGEVFYYTPNDKRMRSFNEVARFLEAERKKAESSAQLNGKVEDAVKDGDKSEETALVNGDVRDENSDRSDSPRDESAGNLVIDTTPADTVGSAKSEARSTADEKPKGPPDWQILSKDNFSFNARVKIGKFLEQKPGEKVRPATVRLLSLPSDYSLYFCMRHSM